VVMREFIPAIRAGLIDRGSHAAVLHRELEVCQQDIVLEKPRFGAFAGTDLDLILRTRGIDSVVICGIATNVCCETTAREASMRDFRVFFLSDATATFDLGGVSREEIQRTVCATLTLFGRVLTTESLLDEIAAATFGLSVARWKIVAFTLGNFITGTAGALSAFLIGFIAPNNYAFGESMIFVSILLLGGIGNPWGLSLAAAIVILLPEKLQVIQEYRFLLFAAMVILMLLFRPAGLLPRPLRRLSGKP